MRKGTLEHITLAEAAKLCPGRPAIPTLWRWARKGYQVRSGERIRLSIIQAGRNIYTTQQALNTFFEQIAAANTAHFNRPAAPPPTKAEPAPQRSGQAARAFADLAAEGV